MNAQRLLDRFLKYVKCSSESRNELEFCLLVEDELKKLGLFLKNRKTVVVSNNKRQTVTGIVVNEKLNLTKQYKKKIRQEFYYIRKYGIDEHLNRIHQKDKEKYINSINGRIAFVLQTLPEDKEFLSYKKEIKAYI